MAADRHRRALGKAAARPSAKQRARERIAAEQAARKRAEARRRILVTGGAITAVLAAFAALVAVKLTAGSAHQGGRESAAPAGIVRQVTTVPAGTLAGVSPGQVATPLQKVRNPGPALTVDGKPAVVFVSEESCPFCAASGVRIRRPPPPNSRSDSTNISPS